jgi:hypothetical protein
MSQPVPFETSGDYMFAELEENVSYPQFTMAPTDKPKYYVPVSPMMDNNEDTKSEESEESEVDEVSNEYAPLDVIAVKQFHQSQMDFTNQLYAGSLTALGLYILYRYLRK